MKKELSSRQKEVFGYIMSYKTMHGFSPTYREIAEHFSINERAAYEVVKALEKKEYIKRYSNKSRAIDIIEETPSFVSIPLIGSIAAGKPIFAEENMEEKINLPETMLPRGGGQFFALRVKGDSMEERGILDGDTAIIKKQDTAENGDIVAALIEDYATLKVFYKEKHRVRLEAANPKYHPIYTSSLKILGKLIFLVRQYG
ncbi:transcriptional repressor LexA [Spirochaetia bacterium 38H-sp]|uniref:LexA repressor n=1 Tax=Rarispira pelagica TaxID=3141764 RepID=A0ABU9U9C2_9SPIR